MLKVFKSEVHKRPYLYLEEKFFNKIFENVKIPIAIVLTGGTSKNLQEFLKDKDKAIILAKNSENAFSSAITAYNKLGRKHFIWITENIFRDAYRILRTINLYEKILNGRFLVLGKEKSRFDLIKYDRIEFNIDKKSLLDKLMEYSNKYLGIAIECFPYLLKIKETPCLEVSYLNSMNKPVACEGDLKSLLGLFITKEVSGDVGFIANLEGIFNNTLAFAHCTINVNLVKRYSYETHFETGYNTSISGEMFKRYVTVFRIDNDRILATYGKIVETKRLLNACRTQVFIKVKNPRKFLEETTGNHHVICYGNILEELRLFSYLTGLKFVKI